MNLVVNVEQGAIDIENVLFESSTGTSLLVHVDTKQKYPAQDVNFDDGELSIYLGVGDETLHTVPNRTGMTLVTITGFTPVDWYAFLDEGKYGPHVAVIMRGELSFVSFRISESEIA